MRNNPTKQLGPIALASSYAELARLLAPALAAILAMVAVEGLSAVAEALLGRQRGFCVAMRALA